MKRSDLSQEDQALLATDFGDLDKVAAEQVKVANEMYAAGVDLAQNTADEMDKLAAEAAEGGDDPAEGVDDSVKVAAADYGNIITEGFIDKLAALGEERHGDPRHYFMPYVEEKVAAVGAHTALKKLAAAKASWLTNLAGKAKDLGKKVKTDTVQAVTGKGARGKTLSTAERLSKGRYGIGAGATGLAGAMGAGYAMGNKGSK